MMHAEVIILAGMRGIEPQSSGSKPVVIAVILHANSCAAPVMKSGLWKALHPVRFIRYFHASRKALSSRV